MKKIIVLFIAICCIMNLTTLNTDAKTKNITLQEVKKQVTQTFGKPVEYKASKKEAGYIYFYNTNILVI